MNNKVAIFIDFDGTLYDNHTRTIPESTIETLKKYHEKYDLFLSTGRTKFILGPLSKYLSLFKGMVLMNGGYVVYDGEILRSDEFEKEDVTSLIKGCIEEDIILALTTPDACYINLTSDLTNRVLDGSDEGAIHDVNGYNYDLSLPFGMAWLLGEKENVVRMANKTPGIDVVPWGHYGGDALIKNHSKADGIKTVLEHLKYKPENTFAIGNGDNDLEMFSVVKYSIAMGNSTEKALKQATYITDDISKDGFMKAFDYIDKVVKENC
ncbi:MAG: Cof-type HAD-IIB family hydrolase [Bacilli bacterium]|nr:Cof-type HAD-IIB family hydrolase [Bacilli bacterium]